MIKDSLKNTKTYYNLSEKLTLGLKWLEETDLINIENGKYLLQEEEVYVTIQDYTSKMLETGRFEAHKKYIDIQYIIKGKEYIGIGERTDFINDTDYDPSKDIEFLFLKNDVSKEQVLEMNEEDFAIFYPQDVHMPMIAVDEPSYVKKAIVKVSI